MMVCCVFTLELPQRGDSNEYTQYTNFNMNKKNTLNYPKSAAMGFFPRDSRMSSKTAVVNEPSVFEPLKFCCSLHPVLINAYSVTVNPNKGTALIQGEEPTSRPCANNG